MKRTFVLLAVGTLAVCFSAVGRADIVLGTEDPVSGFVGPYIAGFPAYSVASDGESGFDPFVPALTPATASRSPRDLAGSLATRSRQQTG